MKVAFQTFGCRLNRAETLDLESQYTAAGHETVHLPQTADDDSVSPDVVIVRCCSVTAKAQKDCEKKIQQLSNRFPKAEVAAAAYPTVGVCVKVLRAENVTELVSKLAHFGPFASACVSELDNTSKSPTVPGISESTGRLLRKVRFLHCTRISRSA